MNDCLEKITNCIEFGSDYKSWIFTCKTMYSFRSVAKIDELSNPLRSLIHLYPSRFNKDNFLRCNTSRLAIFQKHLSSRKNFPLLPAIFCAKSNLTIRQL